MSHPIGFGNKLTQAMSPLTTTTPAWMIAVRAARAKKAVDLKVLDLRGIASFTDYFVICTGTNPRQIQAITDEIREQLAQLGETPLGTEGYDTAQWVLIDFGDFLVHIFSPEARQYYDLERLWRHAKLVDLPEEEELPPTP